MQSVGHPSRAISSGLALGWFLYGQKQSITLKLNTFKQASTLEKHPLGFPIQVCFGGTSNWAGEYPLDRRIFGRIRTKSDMSVIAFVSSFLLEVPVSTDSIRVILLSCTGKSKLLVTAN